jgi:hypothetical protein
MLTCVLKLGITGMVQITSRSADWLSHPSLAAFPALFAPEMPVPVFRRPIGQKGVRATVGGPRSNRTRLG